MPATFQVDESIKITSFQAGSDYATNYEIYKYFNIHYYLDIYKNFDMRNFDVTIMHDGEPFEPDGENGELVYDESENKYFLYVFENEALELQYNGKVCTFFPMSVGTFVVEIVAKYPNYVVTLAPQTLTVTPVTLLTIEPESSTVELGEAIAGKIALDADWPKIFQWDSPDNLESITVWAENGDERTGEVVCFDGTGNISETMAFSIPMAENATPGVWTVYAQAKVTHPSGKGASDCYAVATASVQVEGAEPEYTLTIPASVALGADGMGVRTLNCTQMENTDSVQVTVTSANGFALKDGENAIAYTLSGAEGEIINGGVAATFTGTGTADLSLAAAQGQSPAPGTYTDMLTFTASME